jgi:hypothetical protein
MDKPTGNTKGVKKMKMRKIKGNKKGIDTILAELLMVVIVVVASVMVYAWSTGLLGTLLINPNNNREGPLTLDNSAVCATSNCNYLTINIRNAGSLSVTLNAYYISDTSNNQWANTGYANTTVINPNSVVVFTLKIGTSNGCTFSGTQGGAGTFYNSGTGFFPSGSYTVKVVTARNNPFSFTVTK